LFAITPVRACVTAWTVHDIQFPWLLSSAQPVMAIRMVRGGHVDGMAALQLHLVGAHARRAVIDPPATGDSECGPASRSPRQSRAAPARCSAVWLIASIKQEEAACAHVVGMRVTTGSWLSDAEALSLVVRFSRSSRGRLTDRDLARFPGDTLLDRVGRAVCHAGCLPRKELYEAWETARRVRRLFRGGRVVDLAAGHGLLAQLMLILDDTSPCALAVDAVTRVRW
jgi:hypothetical protein